MIWFNGGGSVVVRSIVSFNPVIVCGVYVLSLFCYALLSALSSFAIILTRKKRVLVAKSFDLISRSC